MSSEEEEEMLFELQRKIASRVLLEDHYSEDVVAGVDQAFVARANSKLRVNSELVVSCAVAFDSSLHVLGKSHSVHEARLPYIPGLLCFREGPAALGALKRLDPKPTLLFVNRCGINHPRGAGLASCIGVELGVPVIGLSKNVLCGSWDPPRKVGEASPLSYKEKHIGYVFLSRKGCKPIVVAPGHMISVSSSIRLARKYLRGHKFPEPCRVARLFAREAKREMVRRN